jgi:voltage-gated potassium channel Kch
MALAWRPVAVLLVFVLVVAAFALGGRTSVYEQADQLPVVAWFYFAASLFVFGGTDLGTPLPESGRVPVVLLWTAYLLAPLITTTVVIDAIRRAIGARALPERGLSEHVVIVGSDALVLAYLDAVHAVDPDRIVLLVEHAQGLGAPVYEPLDVVRRVRRVRGNMMLAETRARLGLERASRVVVMTGEDTTNLECAWALCAEFPALPVAAHVVDLSLLRPVHRILRARRDHGDGAAPMVFSTHRIAALLLYDEHLEAHFAETHHADAVYLGGFGHLGQTFAELLLLRGEEEIATLVVVDPDAAAACRHFALDVDAGALTPVPIGGALHDPGTWSAALAAGLSIDPEATGMALLTADAETNLKVAMLLRAQSQPLDLYAICPTRSAYIDALARELDVRVFYLDEMLSGALRDHYEALSAT